MTRKFDEEAWKRAREMAAERFPLPDDTPGTAAFRGAMISAMIVGFAAMITSFAGLTAAVVITVAVSALIAWSDCRGRFQANSRLCREEYEYLVERKVLEEKVEAERRHGD